MKDYHNPVTPVDIWIENYLRKELSQLLPEAGFIVEEGESNEKEDYNWVIDPIDQTKNFIGQLPLFYIQFALLYRKDPILSLIYNPISNQLFQGSLGNGVFLNDSSIHISNWNVVNSNYIDLDFGSGDDDHSWKLQVLEELILIHQKFRLTGCSYAPYILTQAVQGYLVLNQSTKIVDQMPRIFLMREFGLTVEIKSYADKKIIIAGKDEMVTKLMRILDKCI